MESGWSVSVDGVSAEPLRANYLFRGVQVGQGHHVARWTYRTPGLLGGGVVSVLTLLFLFWMIIGKGVDWFFSYFQLLTSVKRCQTSKVS